jgi:hypothetical protein
MPALKFKNSVYYFIILRTHAILRESDIGRFLLHYKIMYKYMNY